MFEHAYLIVCYFYDGRPTCGIEPASDNVGEAVHQRLALELSFTVSAGEAVCFALANSNVYF